MFCIKSRLTNRKYSEVVVKVQVWYNKRRQSETARDTNEISWTEIGI